VLQPLISLLKQAQELPVTVRTEGTGEAARQVTGWGRATTPVQARQIDAITNEVQRLARQRGIVAEVTPAADGRVTAVRLTGVAPRYDDVESVYATQPLAAGASYRVLAGPDEVTAERLRVVAEPAPAWVRDRYLALPDDLPARVGALAASIAANETTTYDQVRALERALRTLPYDGQASAPPAGRDVVDYFLFDSRRGHCEYFASALTVMARGLGIPARVVTGFNSGDADSGSRLIRERNAHAWTEVYFAGHGWVRFEPTPSVAAPTYGEAPATLPPPVDLNPADLSSDWQEPTGTAETEPTAITTSGPALPGWLDRFLQVVQTLLALALIVVGALALLWWRGVRGLRGAERWYGRAQWLGRWLGVRGTPTTTPREFAGAVARAAPEAAQPVQVLADLYMQERYGGRPPTGNQAAGAERQWQRFRAALLRARLRLHRRGEPDNG
jgi:transglutaminase-like putative cysteine protease